MKINRIIMLSRDLFSKRNWKRFGIQPLTNRGFSVEFWECSPFLAPALFDRFNVTDPFTFPGLKIFHSQKLLLRAIDELTPRDVVLVDLGGVQVKTIRAYKLISKRGIPWGSIAYTAHSPIPAKLKSFWVRALRFYHSPIIAINFLLKKLPIDLFKLRPFQFLMVGGIAFQPLDLELVDSQTNILDAHSPDYDHYLENREQKNSSKTEHVVFLDECGPFHPDRLMSKTTWPCSEKKYFDDLSSFFKLIEDESGCRVIIAAHPKSKYEGITDLFKGRQVVRGESHNLVKNAKFVIASSSTAVHFAVIYKKPIIFWAMTSDRKNSYDLVTEHMAFKLGKSPLDQSTVSSVNLETELAIDGKKYSQFMDDHIKIPGSPERFSWDIFADYLETL